ncbi:hypothetical protein EV356DRAFT_506766 [Viridothelium virens]|uniref:Uncharacterized protein n=1 Tax=Viridothelium virens TaxID=1048519 RepID=A0A6A6H0Z5_VIRVR|nr:hypothetical protein EV356DRAFT_506766 [Viridothelium virens]
MEPTRNASSPRTGPDAPGAPDAQALPPGESSVSGACLCGAVFGEFYNAFIRVTGSYYMPTLVGSFSNTGLLVARGKVRPAAARSELDGW